MALPLVRRNRPASARFLAYRCVDWGVRSSRTAKRNVFVATIKAKCADLFEGKAAEFTGNVTLAENAVFEITDAENLANYTGARNLLALYTTGSGKTISGIPGLKLTKSDGALYPEGDRCSLSLSDDRKSLRLHIKTGLKIIVK